MELHSIFHIVISEYVCSFHATNANTLEIESLIVIVCTSLLFSMVFPERGGGEQVVQSWPDIAIANDILHSWMRKYGDCMAVHTVYPNTAWAVWRVYLYMYRHSEHLFADCFILSIELCNFWNKIISAWQNLHRFVRTIYSRSLCSSMWVSALTQNATGMEWPQHTKMTAAQVHKCTTVHALIEIVYCSLYVWFVQCSFILI